MFVDELTIYAKAGKGGDGVVRWLHEKGKEWSGPAGGNGGKGGDVYIRAHGDLYLLQRYKAKKKFLAGNGESGSKKSMHGKAADDLYIDLPIGSIVKNLSTGEVFNLEDKNSQYMILKGGKGGLGNEFFKNSINRSPEESTPGSEGEEADFSIELQMIADVGLVGLPNAGKSSLLNALTAANARVGSYAFTTIEPNLGDLFGLTIADIPGLIEGASEGKGLGHKFLRHIKRTKAILHLISVENEDILGAYNSVREELQKFDPSILEKTEIIALTKTDTVDPGKYEEVLESAKALFPGKKVFELSIYDDESLKDLTKYLTEEFKK